MTRRNGILGLSLLVCGALAAGAGAALSQTVGPADPAALVPPPGVYNATRLSGDRWDCAGGCYGIYCCVVRTYPT